MKNKYKVYGEVTVLFIHYGNELLEALIDTFELPKVQSLNGTWYAHLDKNCDTPYVYGSTKQDIKKGIKRRTIKLHRWLTDAPKGMVVDHRSHNTLDNRHENLLVLTHAENLQNRKGATKASQSGVRGVYWCNYYNKWFANVGVKGLGRFHRGFRTKEEAEVAAVDARRQLMPYSQESEV